MCLSFGYSVKIVLFMFHFVFALGFKSFLLELFLERKFSYSHPLMTDFGIFS